ncbi:MAG: hypothetical protein IT357_02525 [Gemmatimonadaceae bacterium]|nr:hypothetical protein [Gemmatimonadaceae bacterium]
MDDTELPEPESWGSLEPPRRRPPTAIGLLTPPPPRRPDADDVYTGFLRQRLAQGFVGTTVAALGTAIAASTGGPIGFSIGAMLALGGARMIGMAFRRRPRIFVIARQRRARRRAA